MTDESGHELGIIRDSKLTATDDFFIYQEAAPSWFWQFSSWLNGWLPWGWQLGTVNGRWRFFRF